MLMRKWIIRFGLFYCEGTMAGDDGEFGEGALRSESESNLASSSSSRHSLYCEDTAECDVDVLLLV